MQLLADRISTARGGEQQSIARDVKAGDEILEDLKCSNSAANLYRNGKHAALASAAIRPGFDGFC